MSTRQERVKRMVAMAPMVLVFGAIAVFIAGTVVRLLWNWLMPSIFGLPELTFWPAIGVLILSRILFGGRVMSGSGSRWSQGDREHFRRRVHRRFGIADTPAEPEAQ